MADPASDLEDEQRVRMDEIRFLQNICAGLGSDIERDQMRRSMVVMLYSHFEGFTQFSLGVYIRAIEAKQLKCFEVQPSLATTALKDLFKAIRTSDQGNAFLPSALQGVQELKPLAVERTFVERARVFEQQLINVPDGFVDLESNLKPIVLRKNLFRLALPHDLFDHLEGRINMLLGLRNNIAHGSLATGVQESVYTKLYDAVVEIMDELRRTILDAISKESFRV